MRASLRSTVVVIATASVLAVSAGHVSAAQTHDNNVVRQPALIIPPIQPTYLPTIQPTFLALPDLTIGLVAINSCVWSTYTDGYVWISPLIEAYGTGFNIPAHAFYTMTSNYDLHVASGSLPVGSPTHWAMIVGKATNLPELGHVMTLTMTVDPNNAVAESNESNNVGTITVDLTHVTTVPGIWDTTVPCY